MINRLRKSVTSRYLSDLLGGTIIGLGFERVEGPIVVPDLTPVQLLTTVATLPAGLLAANARLGLFSHCDMSVDGGEIPNADQAALSLATDVVDPINQESTFLAGAADSADRSQCYAGYMSAVAGEPNVPNPNRTLTAFGINLTENGPVTYYNINLFWFVLSS